MTQKNGSSRLQRFNKTDIPHPKKNIKHENAYTTAYTIRQISSIYRYRSILIKYIRQTKNKTKKI